jgi:hypothetical protein
MSTTFSDDDFTYEIISGTTDVKIISLINDTKTSYIIKAYAIDGTGVAHVVKEVTDSLFYGNASLNSISFEQPSYITRIGDYAFYGCANLNVNISVVELFPSTIEYIGQHAFENCASLYGTLNLSNHQYLTTVGDYAFFACTGITGVLLPDNVSFYRINEGTFKTCTEISNELVIPNNILEIKTAAFNNCFKLKAPSNNLVIPASVSKIEDFAFYNNEYYGINNSITAITINSNNITLGQECFYGYEMLDTVSYKDYLYYNSSNDDLISPYFVSNKTINFIYTGIIPDDGGGDVPITTINTTFAVDWITQNSDDSISHYESWNDPTKDNSNPVMASDYDGNIIICFMSTDPSIYPVSPKIFITKLTNTGNLLWTNVEFSSTDNKIAYVVPSIDIDVENNIYVAYFYQNRNTSVEEIVITKFNGQSGEVINSIFYKVTDTNLYSPRVKIDSNRNVYLAFTKGSYLNVNLRKINNNGQLTWSKTTINEQHSYSSPTLAIDSDNNVYIGFSELSPTTSNDIVIKKYDATGNEVWTVKDQTINTMKSDASCKITIKNDFLYLSYVTLGTLSGTGNEHEGNAFTGDIVVVKMNKTDGNKIWGKQSPEFNTPVEDFNQSITVDNSNNVYVAYNTNSSVNLLENPNNQFSQDIVIFKLNSNGVLRGLTQSAEWNNSLIQNAPSNIYTSQELSPTILVDSENKLYISYSSNYSTTNVNKSNVKAMKLVQTVTDDGGGGEPPFVPPSNSPLDLLSNNITTQEFKTMYDNIRVINSSESITDMPIFSTIKADIASITNPDELEIVTNTIDATANYYFLLNTTKVLTDIIDKINQLYPPVNGIPSWPNGTDQKFKDAYDNIKATLTGINESNKSVFIENQTNNSISRTAYILQPVEKFAYLRKKVTNNGLAAELPDEFYAQDSETIYSDLTDNILPNDFFPYTSVSPWKVKAAVKNTYETYSDNTYDSNSFSKYNGNKWISIDKQLPVLTYFGTTVTYNNSIYVIGGLSKLTPNKFNSSYRSTPYFGGPTTVMRAAKAIMNTTVKNNDSTQTIHSQMRLFNKIRWSSSAGPSIKRYLASSVVFNNKIYLIGGHTSYDPMYEYYEQATTDRIETYNGTSWTLLATTSKLNKSRAGCSSVVYKNTIYVIGGYDDGYFGVSDIETLNAQSNAWSSITYDYDANSSSSFYGYSCSAAVYGNSIYILDINGTLFKLTKNTDNTHTLTDDIPQPTMPVSKGGTNSKLIAHNGRMFLIGGDENINSTQVQVFNGFVWNVFNARLPVENSFILDAVIL